MPIIVEKGVGETRAAAFDDDEIPVSLFIWRDRKLDHSARLGDIFAAIVRSVDKGRAEAFVELSNGAAGYFNLKQGQPVPDEGQRLNVIVRAEAHDEKAALVRPVSKEARLLTANEALSAWMSKLGAGFDDCGQTEVEFSSEIDAVFDQILSEQVTLQGGGALYIEQTRAICAVDVDAAGRGADAGEGLNVVAVRQLARQIVLRRLGGTIVIDLVGAPKGARAESLKTLMKSELKALGVTGTNILNPSPLGLMEMTLPRGYRSVCEYAPGVDGSGYAALMFRAVLREGILNRTAQIEVRIGKQIADFLQKSEFDWHSALADRIGNRFTVTSDSSMTDAFTIRPK